MNRCGVLRLLLVATLIGSGCAVQGSAFQRVQPPPEHAVIYVYRPYHYGSSLLRPTVRCGSESAEIGPGGYHAFTPPAGRVICDAPGETSDEVEMDAEPRNYYIREEFGWGVLSGHPHLNPIDADEAHSEIEKCCVNEKQR